MSNTANTTHSDETPMPAFVSTFAEFQKCLGEHELVAVDFTASWCGPCKMIGPVFAELSTSFRNIHFIKVDVDENEETAARIGVQAMPTFVFFARGKKVSDLVGASVEKLKQQLRALDARSSKATVPTTIPAGGSATNKSCTRGCCGEEKKQAPPRSKFDPPVLE